jgi:hypothetical protein
MTLSLILGGTVFIGQNTVIILTGTVLIIPILNSIARVNGNLLALDAGFLGARHTNKSKGYIDSKSLYFYGFFFFL